MPADEFVSAELAAARKLAPDISARALEFERERRVAPDVVQVMAEAGLIQMVIPACYGGLESPLRDTLEVIEAISCADASVGWCLMNYQTTALAAALMEPTAANEIFKNEELAIPAGVLAPTGRARMVDDGFVVDGRWAFASGCDNANWLLGTAFVVDEDGDPVLDDQGNQRVLYPFFSREQVEIHDTWFASGLCASGSHDISVSNALVPAGRWVCLSEAPRVDTPLFRFPIVSTFPPAVAAVNLGVAQAAFDCFVALAMDKVPAGGTGLLSERASAQIDVARAEALIESSRSYVYATVDQLWRDVVENKPASVDARRRIRLAGIHAAASAAAAVDLLYNAAGASSIASSHPLQRYFRDAHAVTQHIHVSYAGMERMGRLRLTDKLDGLL